MVLKMYKNSSSEGDSESALSVDGNIQVSRILCRELSVGQSSHIYYRSAEGVPFKWEMAPGTPKKPREEEVIPPPTPPPAAQSFWPPTKPDQSSKDYSKHSLSRLLFWKKHKKIKQHKDFGTRAEEVKCDDQKISDSSDGEFVSSVQDSRYSVSSSPSSSSSNQSRLERNDHEHNIDHGVHKPFGCSPWDMTGILVRVVKRD